ncbi:hypothetical protein OIU77_010737 [Salix suchowensis]|uniref:Uncharacterized protein n=1 Tax=Salix suchowensis TaxID=1278906 RepID=A0ABQ9A9V7_9ROSI|nr:hypothetical protein OIU77_010737 [Salix suchowensis]
MVTRCKWWRPESKDHLALPTLVFLADKSECFGIVSGNAKGRNQTSHPNNLCPTSCPSSNSCPCHSTRN